MCCLSEVFKYFIVFYWVDVFYVWKFLFCEFWYLCGELGMFFLFLLLGFKIWVNFVRFVWMWCFVVESLYCCVLVIFWNFNWLKNFSFNVFVCIDGSWSNVCFILWRCLFVSVELVGFGFCFRIDCLWWLNVLFLVLLLCCYLLCWVSWWWYWLRRIVYNYVWKLNCGLNVFKNWNVYRKDFWSVFLVIFECFRWLSVYCDIFEWYFLISSENSLGLLVRMCWIMFLLVIGVKWIVEC